MKDAHGQHDPNVVPELMDPVEDQHEPLEMAQTASVGLESSKPIVNAQSTRTINQGSKLHDTEQMGISQVLLQAIHMFCCLCANPNMFLTTAPMQQTQMMDKKHGCM